MRIGDIYNVPAKTLDTLKRLVDNVDGVEKIGNIVIGVASLILLKNGSTPVWLETLSEHFDDYDIFKNSFNWIRIGDGFFSNPYSFKDLTVSKFLTLAKRICTLGVTTLTTIEYWNKLNNFTPIASFPIKYSLLLTISILSNLISGISLYENSAKAKKLEMKKIIILNTKNPKADLTGKMNILAGRINELKGTVGDTLVKKEKELATKSLEARAALPQNAKESDLNKAAEKWLSKVNTLDVQPNDYLGLKKQLKMLKLLENPTLENLNDVRALYEMKNETFLAFKVEQYSVREENLTLERKKAWRSVAQDIAKMGLYGLLIVNAPYLALVPVDYSFVFKVAAKSAFLISGVIGLEKFLFESYNEAKKEPRPSEVAIPLPA